LTASWLDITKEKRYAMTGNILLDVKDVKMHFPVTRGIIRRNVGHIKALEGVSFSIRKGETLGLVGESGCGKTTAGKCILRLYQPTSGEVVFEGRDLVKVKGDALRHVRKRLQMVFQDPHSCLDPRMKCRDIIGEPLKIHDMASRKEYREQVEDIMRLVELDADMADRFAHEFSGGQRQRIGIARALMLKPSLIVCDEPVSALDVSIQAQIINLLQELQEKFHLTYLFIAHDLAVVNHISDRVAVMYLGKIVEIASSSELYVNPVHPYTKSLLSAVPIPDPVIESARKRIILNGDVPSPLNPPSGCTFHPRCPKATKKCSAVSPVFRKIGSEQEEHWVACHQV